MSTGTAAGLKSIRINLQRQTPTTDSFGQEADSGWSTIYTCWAQFTAITITRAMREILTAQQLLATVTHVITIRYSKGSVPTAEDRFYYPDPDRGDRYFNIVGVTDPDESKTELQCLVIEKKTA